MSDIKLIQTRDINGNVVNVNCALPFAVVNQYFLITSNTIVVAEVPTDLTGDQYVAYFTYTEGVDIFVLGAATPTIAVPPDDTPRITQAQLRPNARVVVPGQTIQFTYDYALSNVVVASVGISYYEILSNNTLGY